MNDNISNLAGTLKYPPAVQGLSMTGMTSGATIRLHNAFKRSTIREFVMFDRLPLAVTKLKKMTSRLGHSKVRA